MCVCVYGTIQNNTGLENIDVPALGMGMLLGM